MNMDMQKVSIITFQQVQISICINLASVLVVEPEHPKFKCYRVMVGRCTTSSPLARNINLNQIPVGFEQHILAALAVLPRRRCRP